jgi:hypothetical protein
MKTKIASLAATLLAVASFSSFAFAGQHVPVKHHTSGAVSKATSCCAGQDSTSCNSCCTTRTVPNPTFGGRGSNSSFTKVHSCTMGHGMPAKAKQGSCCN